MYMGGIFDTEKHFCQKVSPPAQDLNSNFDHPPPRQRKKQDSAEMCNLCWVLESPL